jgi:photosystem II stability/assembly factor-like uncharacterized protein
MHPANPDILLAGTGNGVYGDGDGVYLSTDAGMTWRRTMGSRYLVDKTNGDQISAVEIAVSNPQIAYAASGLAMYRSQDGGQTWKMVAGSPSHPGFGPPGMNAGIPVDFQVDPRNPDRIFVNNYTGGNFLSTDGGATWVGLNYLAANMSAWFPIYGPTSEWYAVSADPRNPGR